jgi:serine phosphatase RsbU (regulator of sigma subunit)
MSNQPISGFKRYVRREAEDAGSAVREVLADVRHSWRDAHSVGEKLNTPPVITHSKLKRIILTLLKVFIALELLGALVQGTSKGDWSRLGWDLLLGGVLYVMWDRITRIAREKKEVYRQKMETSGERVRLWDALVFSLLWTDEIYADIPADRRHLVATSYTLITLGVVASFVRFGEGFMSLIVAAALVLAAVNLLGWVLSRERGERDTLHTELRLARDVQLSMMPKCPPVMEGYDIAGLSLPAQEVGGDHFDYVSLGDDGRYLGLTVFDVSGKGMQAAMSAVFTSGAFVSDARRSTSPAEILTRLNTSVYRYSTRGHFVAFLCAVIDRETKTLTFANAGQTKPLLWRNGAGTSLDATGVTFALGMTEDAVYADRKMSLESGDLLLLLSDGFTEAMNPAREVLGMERLEGMVRTRLAEQRPSVEFLASLLNDVQLYAAGAPQHDDMTVVAVKVL